MKTRFTCLFENHISAFSPVFISCAISIKEIYSPTAIKNNPGFLVVDGFLTAAPDSTYITLTRTRNSADSTTVPPEVNIHCISNPSETVLGDLYASTVTRKRMFIDRNQVTLYFINPYYLPCEINGDVSFVIDESDKQKAYDYLEKQGHLYTFLYEYYGYHIAENLCADCREHGGTATKPDFWP
jgi:hypothetical protein